MLKPKQKKVLSYIQQYQEKKGCAPLQKEICKHLRIASPSTVYYHLKNLEAGGYLKKEKYQHRSIYVFANEQMVQIPLLGIIAAGAPIEAIENKETIAVSQSRLPLSTPRSDIYALKVRGDSMVDENINDGDIVLVKEQRTAENGQKVVALLDNSEATLKTFYKERDKIRLQPANKSYAPIFVGKDTPLVIQGVVCEVIKTESAVSPFLSPTTPTSLQPHKRHAPTDKIIQNDKTLYEFYLGDS